MGWRSGSEQGGRVIPRAEGCVLVLYDRQWEDEQGLLPVSDPIPVEDWLRETRQAGYTVEWTPEGAVAEGPYQGSAVVEVTDTRTRSYVAVPPEALHRLAEIMEERDYQMLREDVAALENPEGHGLMVTQLDRAQWEERGIAAPRGEPLTSDLWARVIREQHLRVGPLAERSCPSTAPGLLARLPPSRPGQARSPPTSPCHGGCDAWLTRLRRRREPARRQAHHPHHHRARARDDAWTSSDETRNTERTDKMIAGSMKMGAVERVPLATFVAQMGDYARQLMDSPEHRLELLITEHDGTVVQVALATQRFHSYLAVAEGRRKATDPEAAERYTNEALRRVQVLIVEPGDAVTTLDPSPALVLLPPDLYHALWRELREGLTLALENDPAFVARIVSAQSEEH